MKKQESPSSVSPIIASSHWYSGYFFAILTVRTTPATWGKKAGSQINPCCHSSAFMVSFIHLLMVGSRNARQMLATISAPAQQAMCGSMSSFHMGVAAGLSFPSSASLCFIGLMISSRRNPSRRHTKARIMKGTGLPQNSYRKPPKGGATKHPKDMNARAIPRALDLSASSVYLKEISFMMYFIFMLIKKKCTYQQP